MNTTHVTAPKKSFKVQMLAARETAIIQSVNRLLSEKGFDAMTPEAFGISRFTPEAIWDEMYFSRPITPAKMDKTSLDVAISLIFISGT